MFRLIFTVVFILSTFSTSAWSELGPQTEPDLEVRHEEPAPEHLVTFPNGSYLDLHGLVQNQFLGSFDDNSAYSNLGEARSTFRMRRAELAFEGGLGDNIFFRLMFDPTKVMEFGGQTIVAQNQNPVDPTLTQQIGVMQPRGAVSVLQDFFFTFKHFRHVNLTFGQGLTPLTYDGLDPSGNLLFAERSELGSIYGDQRDIGLWAHYGFERISYQVGIYNGEGGNTLDSDSHKDIILRLTGSPFKGLSVGGSVQRTLAGSTQRTTTISGADIVLKKGGLTGQAEYYRCHLTSGDATVSDSESHGAYGALAYLFQSDVGGWQPAFRVDWFDPDKFVDSDDYWRVTTGLTFLLPDPGTRLLLNYVYSDTSEIDTTSGNRVNMVNHMFITQVQFGLLKEMQ